MTLALYDLTSVYFEGAGPSPLSRSGHSRDHRSDRPRILLAVATDASGVPPHLSILRGHRADTTTLQGLVKILRRRFGIKEAAFVFEGGMSRKLNLEALETRLAAAKRWRPDARKIASQVGRTLPALKARKYFSHAVDAAGQLQRVRKKEVIAAERAHDGW